jgi:transmembrane sensor
MNLESAKQFLVDFGLNRSQQEDRIEAFREWQRQATPEELTALDQWHQQWLMQQKQKLDADPGMLDRNRDWLKQRVLQDRSRTPIKYLLRWAAAAVFFGAIAIGAYFSVSRHPTDVRTVTPREGLIACAVLTLSDGSQVPVDSLPVGGTITDGGLRIVKLDSATVSYDLQSTRNDHQPAPGKGGYNRLTTAEGEEYRVVLPDGSQVWLNSRATLRYPKAFTDSDRTVQLNGEAYFEIRRDPKAPFMVKAPGVNVQVLGTSFDIMAYPEEASVCATLVDGVVAVSRGDERKVLGPAEQAQVSTDAFSVVKANMDEVMAWRRGEFRFKKASIQRVMRQLARWYKVTVDYNGPLPTAPFSGVMTRKETFTQILEALEISKDVHFIVRGNNITVIDGPR